MRKMKISDLTFEKVKSFNHYGLIPDASGMVTEWVARNEWGNAVAFGDTKSECIEDARSYLSTVNK